MMIMRERPSARMRTLGTTLSCREKTEPSYIITSGRSDDQIDYINCEDCMGVGGAASPLMHLLANDGMCPVLLAGG